MVWLLAIGFILFLGCAVFCRHVFWFSRAAPGTVTAVRYEQYASTNTVNGRTVPVTLHRFNVDYRYAVRGCAYSGVLQGPGHRDPHVTRYRARHYVEDGPISVHYCAWRPGASLADRRLFWPGVFALASIVLSWRLWLHSWH